MQEHLKSSIIHIVPLFAAVALGGCMLDRGKMLNVTAPLPSVISDEMRQIDLYAMTSARICDGGRKILQNIKSDQPQGNKLTLMYENGSMRQVDDEDPVLTDFCNDFYKRAEDDKMTYKAIAAFYRKYRTSEDKSENGMLARNGIQDAIMAAADYNCVDMLDTIGQGKITKDVLLSTIGIAANAASVLTTGFTSHLWSSTAGGLAAINSKVDEVVLQQVAYGVLVSGIQMARSEIHNTQIRGGQSQSLKDYTLELAIKDAIRYSNTCNTQIALEKIKENIAKSSIGTAGDPYSTKEGMIKRIEKFNKEQITKFIGYDTDNNQKSLTDLLKKEGGEKQVINKYTQEILKTANNAARMDKIRTMLRLMD